MSYTLRHPSTTRRGSLLTIVVGLHAAILLVVLAAKTIAPQIIETPLLVDLLPAPQIEATPQAKPQPVAKPEAIRQKPQPTPKTPTPMLEPAAPAPAASAVSQARFDADYLRNPPPPYPPLARRMGEEGKVVLRVSVTPLGTADAIEVRSSSGSTRLDESALKTVRNWKFIPAKRGDLAVQSWVLVPFIFKLEQ